ncbi:MAG: type II toxin-antitoxin system Phd/YefM family antitoxin, partial [Chromatiaceae bacterium]
WRGWYEHACAGSRASGWSQSGVAASGAGDHQGNVFPEGQVLEYFPGTEQRIASSGYIITRGGTNIVCLSSRFVFHFLKSRYLGIDEMKVINIKEMRANMGRLDELVDKELELIISRRGQPIARVLPISRRRLRPDHADLRRCTAELTQASAVLIRAERDER